MALTIPKQTITGALSAIDIAAPVAVPMQLLVASVAMDTALQASFGIPMQSIFGIRPEISATIGIPAQQVQAEMFQPILAIPMQQVSAEVAAPLEVQGRRKALEQAGVIFVADTCVVVTPILPRLDGAVLMTNSGKFAHYGPGLIRRGVWFGGLGDCVESAVTGTPL